MAQSQKDTSHMDVSLVLTCTKTWWKPIQVAPPPPNSFRFCSARVGAGDGFGMSRGLMSTNSLVLSEAGDEARHRMDRPAASGSQGGCLCWGYPLAVLMGSQKEAIIWIPKKENHQLKRSSKPRCTHLRIPYFWLWKCSDALAGCLVFARCHSQWPLRILVSARFMCCCPGKPLPRPKAPLL